MVQTSRARSGTAWGRVVIVAALLWAVLYIHFLGAALLPSKLAPCQNPSSGSTSSGALANEDEGFAGSWSRETSRGRKDLGIEAVNLPPSTFDYHTYGLKGGKGSMASDIREESPQSMSQPPPPSRSGGVDAFAMMCIGRSCDVQQLCLSALALRKVGGWQGPLYVLSDQPEHLRQTCQVDFSTVYQPTDEGGLDTKLMRLDLLSTLPGSPAMVVLLEPHVIVTSCLHPFIAYLSGLPGNMPLSLAPKMPCRGCDRTNRYSTALWVFRSSMAASSCLSALRQELTDDAGRGYNKDLAAIAAALTRSDKLCDVIHKLPTKWFVSTEASGFISVVKRIFQRPVFTLSSPTRFARWQMQPLMRSLEADSALSGDFFAR